jgi:hypothetical protein
MESKQFDHIGAQMLRYFDRLEKPADENQGMAWRISRSLKIQSHM